MKILEIGIHCIIFLSLFIDFNGKHHFQTALEHVNYQERHVQHDIYE